jgi:hypothetical protein
MSGRFIEIRTILCEEWDPIGVVGENHDLNTEDEYDSYALELLGIMERGCSLDGIKIYLSDAERYIGVDNINHVRISKTADRLLKLSRGESAAN